MSITNEQVVDFLGNMSIMELIKLTKEMEQQWGVEAKPQPVMIQQSVPTETKVEQTEFNVIFVSFAPDKKMGLIKLVREVMNMGLVDSKNMVESLPKMLKEGASKEEAEAIKARFVEAGATVEIR